MSLLTREQIIGLINKILDVEKYTEEEIDAFLDALEKGVMDPCISNYIYWDELTPEEIADRVLSYKPIYL